MRLHWKFVIIVSVTTLVAMGSFFVYDYYLARSGMNAAYIENLRLGVNLPQIAERIAKQVEVVVQEGGKMPELSGPSPETDPKLTLRMDIRDALNVLKKEHSVLMSDVLDVYVTSTEGTILGSLNDRARFGETGEPDLELPFPISVDVDAIRQIAAGGIYMGDLSHRHHGQRASVIMSPYYREWSMTLKGDVWEQTERFALVQVIYSTENAWKLLNTWRMRHLIYIFVTGFVLQFVVITFAIVLMVSHPLQRIIIALERAEEGDLEIEGSISYSDTGITSLLTSLHRMLNKMRAAQRERIAEMATLASGLAHEIRNPLSYINMTADYLKRRLSAEPITEDVIAEIQEGLDTVIEEVAAVNQVTQRFSNLTRPPVIERQPVDVNQLLTNLLASMSAALQRASVDVVSHYGTLPLIAVDAGKLRQALRNIIQNAIQAMSPRSGRLYVSTQLQQRMQGPHLLIGIRDTGRGMPRHVQERIFETYFTTRESEGGLGLGLPITRQIIQAHDGQIDVQSQEGMGTRFLIDLPIVVPE